MTRRHSLPAVEGADSKWIGVFSGGQGDPSLECDNFDGEEIGPGQNIQMSTDEVFPTRSVLSFGGGSDVVTTKDIADGLV